MGIDDRRVGQGGQLQQSREVGIGTRQARHLQAKDGAHFAQASHTYRYPFRRLRSKTMLSRWPISGWNGWVTTSEPEDVRRIARCNRDSGMWRGKRQTWGDRGPV